MVSNNGVIEVITGPMYSGKSEELIKRVRHLGFANIKTLVIKPKTDTRWEDQKIISRAGSSIDTKVVSDVSAIKELFKEGNYEAIAIDEVQFFGNEILDIVSYIANKGYRVIISGLDKDFSGKGFGCMPELIAIADKVDKQVAVCNVCHANATMSFRKVESSDQVLVGNEEYEPRCRVCHAKGSKK